MEKYLVEFASAGTGEDTPWRRQGWNLAQAYVSPVGVGLRMVQERSCCRERRESFFDLLFNFREIALQSDLLMPFVVAVSGGETLQKAVQAWRRRQDYHRAAFLLLPEDPGSRERQACQLENMLYPEALDIVSFRPNATLSLQDFWQYVESAEGEDRILDRTLVDILSGWKNADISVNISPKRAWDLWRQEWDKLFSGWDGKIILEQPEKKEASGGDEKLDAPDKVYTRICSAAIEGFKGIDRMELDLDADIVLVTGANGNGKSSLVEALALAMSGYHPDLEDGRQDSFFFYDQQKFRISLKAQAWDVGTREKLSGELLEVTGERSEERIQLQHTPRLDILRREMVEAGPDAGKEMFLPVAPQLNFRMTTYLPDFVRLLFDEEVAATDSQDAEAQEDAELSHCLAPEDRTVLLRQMFPPLAPSVEALCSVVDARLGDIGNSLKSLNRQIEDLENTLVPWEDWKEFFLQLQQRFRSLPVPAADKFDFVKSLPMDAHAVTELREWLKDRRKAIGALFNDYLEKWLSLGDVLRAHGREYGRGDMAEKIHQLEDEVKRLHAKKEKIESDLGNGRKAMVAADIALLRDALALFGNQERCSGLVMNLDSLLRLSGSEQQAKTRQGKADIVREVELVDSDKAGQCAGLLGNLVGDAKGKIKALEEKLKRIKGQLAEKEAERKKLDEEITLPKAFKEADVYLKKSASKKKLKTLDKFESDTGSYKGWVRQRRELEARKAQLKRLGEIIREQRNKVLADREEDGDGCSFRQAFEETMNRILHRFVLADGIEQVALTPEFRITAVDGAMDGQGPENRRGLDCFSSGQKAQLAMAWLVASRELIHHEEILGQVHFPHRILVMDDPSTTFDTTNLLSQAILWRQLAYNPDPRRRYQVFIVSHHEEFSAHLLDLLCPPEGYSMRLLRFTDWTVETGSVVSGYTVRPAPDSIETAREVFGRGLQDFGKIA